MSRWRFAFLFCWGCCLLVSAATTGDRATEYKVKAAYIYNFVKFVKWPADTLPKPSDALTICSAGADPLEGELGKLIKDKTVDGHPLALHQVESEAELKACQVLFVSGHRSLGK